MNKQTNSFFNYVGISRGDKNLVCLIDGKSEKVFTRAEVIEEVSQRSLFLKRKSFNRGDRVIVLANNSIELTLFYFTAWNCGLVLVPINPISSPSEIEFIIQHSAARAIVFDDASASALNVDKLVAQGIHLILVNELEGHMTSGICDAVESEFLPEAEALIVYTSGTTAVPKAVVHSLGSLVENAKLFGSLYGLNSTHRFLNHMSMTYLGGIYNLLLLPLVNQCSVVIVDSFGPASIANFWKPIQRWEVNTLWLVPTMVSMLLRLDRSREGKQYAKENVQLIFCGTAPLPLSLKAKFEETYGKVLLENYGLSETLFLSSAVPGKLESVSSVGRALEGVRIAIRDGLGRVVPKGQEGEILVSTPFMMKGYFDPEKNRSVLPLVSLEGEVNSRWFETGDIGVVDTSGNLRITGRKKDLIIRGGINISPASIEDIVLKFPKVAEACVVGIPHETMGEQIALVLKVQEGLSFSEVRQEVLEYCSQVLSKNKQPALVVELDQIPKTPSGKVLKNKVKAWLNESLEFRKKPVEKELGSQLPSHFYQASRVVTEIQDAISIRFNNLVYEKKAKGEDVIVLSLGEAFFDIPLRGLEGLPFPDLYHYTHSRGVPGLRKKISEYFLNQYQVRFDPQSQIIVTAGSKIAVYMSLLALLNPEDEVLIHEPAWVSYTEQVKLCHARPVMVPHDKTVYDFEKYITNRTRLMIINNPNNPRGKLYSLAEFGELCQLAKKYNLYVLSDEAYSDFVEDSEQFISAANLDLNLSRTIIVNSISKNFGISGWRVGYIISNPNMIDLLLKLNQHLVTCAPTVLQFYVEKYFDEIIETTKPQIKKLVSQRFEVSKILNSLDLSFLSGDSTFYFFVNIGSSRLSSLEFCEKLLKEQNVCVVPGIGYGPTCDRFVRVSVGTENLEQIAKGLKLLKKQIEETTHGK